MLDSGAVPDLYRNGHAQHRRKDYKSSEPRPAAARHQRLGRRSEIEDLVRTKAMPDGLPENLEPNRRRKQDDHPIDLESTHESPHVPMEIREEERRKMPDRLFRTQLAQPDTRKPASDREGKRNPFTGD